MELPLLQVVVETLLYLKLPVALVVIFALYQELNILGTLLYCHKKGTVLT
jgi:hypothetical protein